MEPGMIILGIDPGLQHTGLGLIEVRGNTLKFIHCETISPKANQPLEIRLRQLHEGVAALLARFAPDVAAIEETFVTANGQSTLKLGQARGALILTLALAGLPVHEYAARLVKKTITGSGAAHKDQIAMMVKTLLPASSAALTTSGADAADALAIAITHAQHAPLAAMLSKKLS